MYVSIRLFINDRHLPGSPQRFYPSERRCYCHSHRSYRGTQKYGRLMEIIPSQIIGYRNPQSNGEIFHGYNPNSGEPLSPAFREATQSEINESIVLANSAFILYRQTSPSQRSLFLDTIAINIEALGDDLLKKINEETALPLTRLTGERSRTTGQLRLFAQLLRDG